MVSWGLYLSKSELLITENKTSVKAFAEDSILQKIAGVLVCFFFFFLIHICVLCSLYPVLYSDQLVYLSTRNFTCIRWSSPDTHGL